MYQQIKLADHSTLGAAGPLPLVIAAWAGADDLLADLSAIDPQFGFAGTGFWPVILTTPAFDATTLVLAGTITLGSPDPTTKTVPATADVRYLSPAELAAALALAQSAKLTALTAACGEAIVGGYSSAALGSAHTYPSAATDQANMTASVVASLLPGLPGSWTTPFWCADASSAWSFQPHTAAQIQQAGLDGKATILAAQAKLAGLKTAVAAATTVAQVDALSW